MKEITLSRFVRELLLSRGMNVPFDRVSVLIRWSPGAMVIKYEERSEIFGTCPELEELLEEFFKSDPWPEGEDKHLSKQIEI